MSNNNNKNVCCSHRDSTPDRPDGSLVSKPSTPPPESAKVANNCLHIRHFLIGKLST
jgi:hypothetical protein